jgi:hypothetical protein
MHGFNLLLGSVLAFPWAQDLLLRAQRVVTYFRADHQPYALLKEAGQPLGIQQALLSANKTRFTSKHMCISSVLKNYPAFHKVMLQNADVIQNDDVEAILTDTSFWSDLRKLDKLLLPLSRVLGASQDNTATLADICRWAPHKRLVGGAQAGLVGWWAVLHGRRVLTCCVCRTHCAQVLAVLGADAGEPH